MLVVADPLEPLNCPTDEDNKQHTDGRMFLCLLRLLVNHEDHLAWRTLLGLRRNGIGESTFEDMYELARKDEHTFSQILQRVKDEPGLVQRGNIVKNEVEQIENILDSENPSAYKDLLTFIQSFSEKHIADENERTEVCELFERILALGEIENLEYLLRVINVSIGDKEQETEKGAINLMTMHQAKGLNADAIFVIAAENEYIPGRASGIQKDDERRLLYVSITRARRFLFLTHCKQRTGQQRHTGSNPGKSRRTLSEFLDGGPIESEDGVSFIQGL
ncbi:MAG: ATP-binding domain-containing protein [Deltaproteobacteria bacterium]|nr:ATP-binding domain-containing protein [Deltaproteobacteria bacterium]